MPLQVDLSRLPQTDEHFVGRQRELALLDDAWTTGKNAISIVAWGGVGKTALVRHWLGRLAQRRYDDVRVYAWSFYSQGTDERRVASADAFIDVALRRFGDDDPTAGSARDRGLRVAELVRAERTLLVLDGIEPLQHPPASVQAGGVKDPALAALLTSLAEDNDGLCVVTTRQKALELAPFTATAAPRIDLEQLGGDDGAELLRQLGVQGSEDELVATAKEFGGHALALRLLGTYLKRGHNGEVRCRDKVPILKADARQGGHAFRVMEAYEDWFGKGTELSILRLLGFFDRPADGGLVRALLASPAIAGLTEGLTDLQDEDWSWTLSTLREIGLVAEAVAGDARALDAHPLVGAYFADVLERRWPEAWRAGHLRLYEHLCASAVEMPDTVEEMTPLFAAVVHGCRAGRQQEAFREVYRKRIQRGKAFNWQKLGAFGSSLTALSGFFDRPWDRPSEALEASDQGFVLNEAGVCLRALGRLTEAVQPMRAGVDLAKKQDQWKNAAIGAGNLSELQLTVGEVEPAVASAEESVRLADRSEDAFGRMASRTTMADALHQAGRRAESAVAFREAEEMQAERQPQYPRLYSLWGYRYCDLLLGRLPSFTSTGTAGVPPALRPEGTSLVGQAPPADPVSQRETEDGRRSLPYGGRSVEIHKVIERAEQTLKIAKEQFGLLDVALDNLTLGRAHHALALTSELAPHPNPLGRAEVYLDRAVELLRQAGQEQELPRGLLARAALRRAQADPQAALADLREAEHIAVRGRMRLHECDVHLERTRLDIACDHPTDARQRLEQARQLIGETGYHRRDEDVQELAAVLAGRLKSQRGRTKNEEAGGTPAVPAGQNEERRGEKTLSKKHVFLSYCRDDKAAVRQLRDDLVAGGETVWWDEDILPGANWRQSIRRAMKDAYAVIVCLSQAIDKRDRSGVFPELRDAIDDYRLHPPGSIFLIPVRLDDCEIPDLEVDATTTLDGLQVVDLFPSARRAESFRRLLRSLQAAAS
jgi:tetratricopeptide (TPR) repeat protein